MECQFCHKVLKTMKTLKAHQQTTKYCLKIQGKGISDQYRCDCGKRFTRKFRYDSHRVSCNYLKQDIQQKYEKLQKQYDLLLHENKILKQDKRQLQQDYKDISLSAVKKPTISNKTMNINNFIKNMQPLKVQDIESSVPLLTLEHHAKGAEGYAEFALEFPFKDKIVCVDVSRNKIKYKNDDGDIIEDVGFRKMMVKLCKSLKDRSFNLSLEHEYKLSDTWTEKELESVDFMEAAVAIAKYAQGRENEFCNKIIKLISKGSTSPL